MKLNIIVDVSGSMNEMGKIHIQRNLCRYAAQLKSIDQEKYTDINIYFFQWTQSLSEIAVQSDGDVPVLISQSSSNLAALSDFLSNHLDKQEILRTLILSDGYFDRKYEDIFLKWKRENSNVVIRMVAIGADANLSKLKILSSNNSVYFSENIASAIDSTLFEIDEPLTVPESIEQILQAKPVKQEDDWDA